MIRLVPAALGEREAAHTAVLGTSAPEIEPHSHGAVGSDPDVGVELQLVLAPGLHDAVEHVAGGRDGAQGVGGAFPDVRGGFDVDVQTAGDDRAAHVDIHVARLTRRLGALAGSRRIERLVGEVEVDGPSPPAGPGARDDLDARSLAATIHPERGGVDDDPGDFVGTRQPALVEPVDDEAGHVVLQVAGGVRAGEEQKIERQVFFVGRQSRKVVAGQVRGRQAGQDVDAERVPRVDDVDVFRQDVEREGDGQRLEAGNRADRLLDGPEGRRRHLDPVGAGVHVQAEPAVRVRRGLQRRVVGAFAEDADRDRPHHTARFVGDGPGQVHGLGRRQLRGRRQRAGEQRDRRA